MDSNRLLLTVAALGVAGTPAAGHAAQLSVNLEIPKPSVAEYHKPYVAIWIERPDQTAVKTLAVWWELKARNDEGAKYLKDLRQWWRRTGRSQDMNADGISGPTRAPGRHQVTFTAAQLADLPAGSYDLVVEASREVGGREVLKAPFQWPGRGAKSASAKGAAELGAISLTVKP